MNNIDTLITIYGMAASTGARSKPEPQHGKVPVKDTATTPCPDNAEFNPVRTGVSFSTYGSRNERIAVVVKNQETGEVIREIPSKEMQKLHVHLDTLI
jgi:uncharacterized FlaG/YvyC family protein